jgi:hypothetical protein
VLRTPQAVSWRKLWDGGVSGFFGFDGRPLEKKKHTFCDDKMNSEENEIVGHCQPLGRRQTTHSRLRIHNFNLTVIKETRVTTLHGFHEFQG